jgi:hypothetical protein
VTLARDFLISGDLDADEADETIRSTISPGQHMASPGARLNQIRYQLARGDPYRFEPERDSFKPGGD